MNDLIVEAEADDGIEGCPLVNGYQWYRIAYRDPETEALIAEGRLLIPQHLRIAFLENILGARCVRELY